MKVKLWKKNKIYISNIEKIEKLPDRRNRILDIYFDMNSRWFQCKRERPPTDRKMAERASEGFVSELQDPFLRALPEIGLICFCMTNLMKSVVV